MFTPPKSQPDFDGLITTLTNSKVKTNDNALYQTIFNLIQRVRQARDLQVQDINNNTTNIIKVTGDVAEVNQQISITNTKVAAIADEEFVMATTVDTTLLPNARQLVAGTNITLTTSTNQLIIAATSGTTSGGGVTTTGTINTGSLVVFASDTTITSGVLSGDIIGATNSTITTINTGAVTEVKQTLADNTTWDVSTTQHGYVPKATGSTTDFLRADGTYAVPNGSGIVGQLLDFKYKRKTANENITSTVLQDDDDLFFPTGANEEWVVDFSLYCISTSGTPKLAYRLTTPAGAEVKSSQDNVLFSVNSSSGDIDRFSAPSTAEPNIYAASGGFGGAGFAQLINFHAIIVTAATTGTCQLQWAQFTTSTIAITLQKLSHMEAKRFV